MEWLNPTAAAFSCLVLLCARVARLIGFVNTALLYVLGWAGAATAGLLADCLVLSDARRAAVRSSGGGNDCDLHHQMLCVLAVVCVRDNTCNSFGVGWRTPQVFAVLCAC